MKILAVGEKILVAGQKIRSVVGKRARMKLEEEVAKSEMSLEAEEMILGNVEMKLKMKVKVKRVLKWRFSDLLGRNPIMVNALTS